MRRKSYEETVDAIRRLCEDSHRISSEKGFWDGDQNKAEKIALIHSELSEALEGIREGTDRSDKIPEFTPAEEELADAIIRICDMAEGFNLDLARAIMAKMEYNETREHMHGKNF